MYITLHFQLCNQDVSLNVAPSLHEGHHATNKGAEIKLSLFGRTVLLQAQKVHGWTLFDWLMRDGEDGAKRHMHHMWELLLDGTIKPLTGIHVMHHALLGSANWLEPSEQKFCAQARCRAQGVCDQFVS